jgi:hypothetical protein
MSIVFGEKDFDLNNSSTTTNAHHQNRLWCTGNGLYSTPELFKFMKSLNEAFGGELWCDGVLIYEDGVLVEAALE